MRLKSLIQALVAHFPPHSHSRSRFPTSHYCLRCQTPTTCVLFSPCFTPAQCRSYDTSLTPRHCLHPNNAVNRPLIAAECRYSIDSTYHSPVTPDKTKKVLSLRTVEKLMKGNDLRRMVSGEDKLSTFPTKPSTNA